MLTRVLEPQVMDSIEVAQAYDAMHHDAVNRAFVDDLVRAGQIDAAERELDLLDLGCGTARIPIELCRRVDRVRVLAVDLSDSMLRIARLNIELAGLTGRIVLDLADSKQLPYEDGRFAAVISNSLIHHLPYPFDALSETLRVLAPGGTIFFRDLLRPPDDAAVKRLVEQYVGDETPAQQQLFDDSLRAALSLQEIRDMVTRLGMDRLSVRTTSDRHWTWSARKSMR